MSDEKDQERAKDQAKAQYESIAAMVAALECDYGRLEELRDERESIVAGANAAEGDVEADVHIKALVAWDAENGEELRELTEAASAGESPAYACKSQDDARERIEQDPLSIQIRSDWYSPGETPEPGEFEILLCTGGPAVRIRGELDEHREPYRAWIEYQDWFTPWVQYFGAEQETLLTYCRVFYFGE